jgi:hypothetical protein
MSQIARHDFEASGPPTTTSYYEATEDLGTPFKVFLASGVVLKPDPATGKEKTSIADLPGLIATVVRSRVLHSRKLSGADLRYIRSALCMKAKVLAAAADMTAENYSRCEAGRKPMSSTTEKVYRSFVFLITFARDKDVQDTIKQRQADSPVPPDEAQKALAGFQKLFLEMKISPIFDPAEQLEFTFTRGRRPKPAPCGGDDGEWKSDVDQIAA